jgi:4-hydroxy-tetrahydrodipicolinate reductase
MKVAVLGKGKTGSKVIDVLNEQKISCTVFDSQELPTISLLKNHDVIISFLAGEPFAFYVDMLIESKIPVVSGTTGFIYSEELKAKLFNNNLKWIVANNFSLGMNIVKQMIQMLGKANLLMSNPEFKIHEVHHVKKVDSPSGTALSFEKWLGQNAKITSERMGDVIGFHELSLKTKNEEIKLSHNALDRRIFAEGAVWAAHKIINNQQIPYGLNYFSDVVEKELIK